MQSHRGRVLAIALIQQQHFQGFWRLHTRIDRAVVLGVSVPIKSWWPGHMHTNTRTIQTHVCDQSACKKASETPNLLSAWGTTSSGWLQEIGRLRCHPMKRGTWSNKYDRDKLSEIFRRTENGVSLNRRPPRPANAKKWKDTHISDEWNSVICEWDTHPSCFFHVQIFLRSNKVIDKRL